MILNRVISEITIPYFKSGETLQPGSVEIHNPNKDHYLKDDGFGNLYKSNRHALTDDFHRRHKIVLGWDFSKLYPIVGGYSTSVDDMIRQTGIREADALVEYTNSNYPEAYSRYYGIKCFSSERYGIETGAGISLHKNSFIQCPHTPEFNLINGTFLIKFTLNQYIDIDTPSNIISTNSIKSVPKKGLKELTVDQETLKRQIIYNEIQTIKASAFPFNIEMITGNIVRFTRSDGKITSTIDFLIEEDGAFNFQYYRYPDGNAFKISLFVNGGLIQTITDNTKYCFNDYDLLIGNYIDQSANMLPFNLNLGNIEIYNSLPSNSISDIALLSAELYDDWNNHPVGNVFYRNGQIILNPIEYQDQDWFDNCEVKYNSIHTIYEYEALVRVGKGEYNLSQNPSARVSYESDILIDEFQSGILNPYVTSIGIYDKDGNLLIIGKLSQAVQMRDDVDLNFLITWST